jgi:hypothetical protein
MADMNKHPRIAAVLILLLGIAPLLNSLSNPRLAAAHGSDYLRLIAAGWCFGIGSCLLAISFGFFEKR